MRFITLVLLSVFSVCGFSLPKERKLYVGKDSTEAILKFSTTIEIISRSGKPDADTVNNKIELQLAHLFGPMGESNIKAVPKGDHKISKHGRPTLKENTKNTYSLEYDYEGTIVVQNKAKKYYDVILPINPDTIYKASKVGKSYPCTDSHYNSEDDFWYFWNPDFSGCRLQEGVDYFRIKGVITRSENTENTYPEYARLVRKLEGKEVIPMTVFLGLDEADSDHNPLESKDVNAETYRSMREALLKMGFSVETTLSKKDVDTHFGKKLSGDFFLEELVKETEKAELKVRLFFGETGIDERSQVFHYLYKEALESNAVMMYDGHSGLGGHLDIASIEQTEGFKIQIPKNQYQIYYFNSCSSYPYYNSMYFAKKVTASDALGHKNLDILTNGLATYFSSMHDTNLMFVKAIDYWATGKGEVSYQVLAKKMDSDNLFGVNGDEDNIAK